MAEKKPGYPWDNWSDEERARAEKAVKTLEAVKLYRSGRESGNPVAPAAAAKVDPMAPQISAMLEKQGGLDPQRALELARYRQFKQTTGGDPAWQGPMNINAGERAPADTPEQINARREAYFAASPKDRSGMLADEHLAVERSGEGYFDSLAAKPKAVSPAAALDASMAPDDEKKNRKRKGA